VIDHSFLCAVVKRLAGRANQCQDFTVEKKLLFKGMGGGEGLEEMCY
jgi:hypothetical protein